ncbi:FAD-dependent oxidoreductase [Mycoplasmopsis bovis]|uniref:FAD-dependent oxidoreductase n=1 Tax=Mycoplasmopsis bovis TaxID=28903 RepID=UPI0012602CE5|nr:FAD-dependent oxidoreductase [Mycoplasmopsis bovis]MBT1369087.1 NADH oxidase [Mycoplasmopsis bovis]MCA8841156.1 FAD-dependent oxidoreductase [Mycoplasmopsis bovis]MCA8841933.1 FAD-dependent oxidoreductase [Mycoplasmopsis bovis]MCA8844229.1 FAD-dependent oxidoreductase [Mycoplasmopsis bovis]MCA8845059.1 FAD-dependent oxidoreductase [Mycoplasmopsis bovis]
MKIILVGANHAGTSFIRTVKTVNKDVQITAYDRNTNVSFLGCGIAVWVGGEFSQPDGLFYSSPDILRDKYGVDLKTEHEVIKINKDKKEVVVKNLKTGEEFTDSYDKLVFAGGTWPIEPKIPGIEYNNIVLLKLFQHAQHLVELANNDKIKNVVVVGAGYIGIELTEAFWQKGKNVTLIDNNPRVIGNYFDPEFTDIMETNIKKDGVKLALGEMVKEFKSVNGKDVSSVVTDKGEHSADLVIMSVGFRPRTEMVEAEKLPNGAIKVNDFQQILGDENIYVIGDSSAIKHSVTGNHAHVALATNAVKTGVVAALHIAGLNIPFPGVAGTNAINVFGCHYTSTGFTEEAARRNGLTDVASVYFEDFDRPEFMSTSEKVACKIVYDTKTLKLVGAQIGSWGNAIHTETIFMLALAIQKGLTLPEIALTDVYFLPHFNKPFNFVLVPILKALGIDYKY